MANGSGDQICPYRRTREIAALAACLLRKDHLDPADLGEFAGERDSGGGGMYRILVRAFATSYRCAVVSSN